MKRALAIVVFMSLLTALTGCITTEVKGYTDREYTGFRIGKVAVRAPNAGFAFGELVENSMVNAFRNRGVQAESFLAMFPPTREWTNEEVAKELIATGFDSIMYVTLVYCL